MSAEPRQDLPIPLPVALVRPNGSRSIEFALNLSPGGVCLHLSDPLVVGMDVEVTFTLPPAGPEIQTRAEVVWTSFERDPANPGGRLWETGLRFAPLSAPLAEKLKDFAELPRDRRR